jgi:hypothetical protein
VKQYWEQLTPQERRWAVGAALVVFVLLNYFFVRPHLPPNGDWAKNDARLQKANDQIEAYNKEVRHKAEYQRRINELQSDGSSVPPEDQAIDFIRFFSTRAINNKVVVTTQGTLTTRTNEFFLNQQMGVSVVADETNLVSFLFSLGAGNSMMRVRAMSLHPDQSHQNLSASITLEASYLKKATTRPTTTTPDATTRTAAAPAPPTAPAPKPSPATKPVAAVSPDMAAKLSERSNRIANLLSRNPGLSATNKPGPSIAKRP